MIIVPIGIIDSGSGGLSIWREITKLMPSESTVYMGDHAYLPYSDKSTSVIRNRVKKLIQFLIAKNCKLIIIACNTATVAGIDWYRKQFPTIPIVGIVPVVKTAASKTKTNEICILATRYTANSVYQKKLINEFASNVHVTVIGSSQLVTYVESEISTRTTIIEELRKILKPLNRRPIDVVVLGCTHFPFIKKEIRHVIGPSIKLLDSGGAVTRHVQRILKHNSIIASSQQGTYVFYTTGEVQKVTKTFQKLLHKHVVVQKAPIA